MLRLNMDELVDLVYRLRYGQTVSADRVERILKDCAEEYEEHRPARVGGSSPYYGTIRGMDEIYCALSILYKFDTRHVFSRGFSEGFMTMNGYSQKQRGLSECDWSNLAYAALSACTAVYMQRELDWYK